MFYDQQFQIQVYNYWEKLIHVHKETILRVSRAAMFETQKKRSQSQYLQYWSRQLKMGCNAAVKTYVTGEFHVL